MVGSEGHVHGVSRNREQLRQARERADVVGARNVGFCQGDGESTEHLLYGLGPFDALVGRFFLLHESDPAATLRRYARLLRPGGLVAFLELELAVDGMEGVESEVTQRSLVTGFGRVFLEAGLGWPEVRIYLGRPGIRPEWLGEVLGCPVAIGVWPPVGGAWVRIGLGRSK